MTVLYSYWRSTAAYRVRIALNLKQIDHEILEVDLIADGGGQHAPAYSAKNPARLVPCLEMDDGLILTQSLAIIDYLEFMQPSPPLIPSDPPMRAKALALAHMIAMDIHPINNLRVMRHLEEAFHAKEAQKLHWMHHWMGQGLKAFQEILPSGAGFCLGDALSIADICLIPQLYNARRWNLDLTGLGRLTDIEEKCLLLDAFKTAAPERQLVARQ